MTHSDVRKAEWMALVFGTALIAVLALASSAEFVLAEASEFGPTPSFVAPRVFRLFPFGDQSSNNPRSLVLGDFNRDGKSDVAVTNYSSPWVTVVLANGDGTFGPPNKFAVGSFPTLVTTEDINGDGNLDLAVANSSSPPNFSVLLGNGFGGFAQAINSSVGSSPESLAIADFNNDGLFDVVTANPQVNTVSRLLGDGAGHFSMSLSISVGSRPSSIVAGDFNGDSRPDVVVANTNSANVQLLLNDGSGGLAAPLSFQVGTNPFSVITTDLNADSKLDLVVANLGSNSISVLLGTGTGDFGSPLNLPTGSRPFSTTAGDVNADGKVDLAVANSGSNDISIFLGDGFGGFAAATTIFGGSIPHSLAIDDFDADGDADLALVNSNGAYLWIILGKGDGSFVTPPSYTTGSVPFFVVAHDFNADGKLDLATANFGSNDVSILIGAGAGQFGAPVNYPVGSNPRSLALADFNKDNRTDLLVGNGSNTVSVLLGTGTGTFGGAAHFTVGPAPPVSMGAGDFNGDGNGDVVAAVTGTSLNATNMSVLLGNGAGAFSDPIFFHGDPVFNAPSRIVAVADFNADGKSDIAMAADRLSIILGNSSADFAQSAAYVFRGNDGVTAQVAALVPGDLNDDGRIDLAVSIAGHFSVLLGNGDGTFNGPTNFDPAGFVTGLGDFNNDGKTDVVMSGAVSVLNGDGLGSFGPSTSYGVGPSSSHLAVGDFNDDGKLDLAVADSHRNGVFILLNELPGSPLNPIDNARTFIRQQYLDFLNREPDFGGWDYWTSGITQCGSDLRCIHDRRIDVSAAFFIELEFQETGYVVYRIHRAAFGNWPGAPARANIGFARFMTDRGQLVPGPGLPQSTANFVNAFVQRPEFLQAYPNSLTNEQFVNQLFDTAGLIPFTTERQQAIDAMNSSTNPRTRAQVLLDVIEIPAFKTREYNGAFVLMQYFGYLRRDPEQAGYDFWLDVLNNRVPGNFRGMVCAFLTSAEYQHRFGIAATRTDHDCGP